MMTKIINSKPKNIYLGVQTTKVTESYKQLFTQTRKSQFKSTHNKH